MIEDITRVSLEKVHAYSKSALNKERILRQSYSLRMSLFLVIADLLSILTTTAIICVLWLSFRNNLFFNPYIEIIPLVLIFPILYKLNGLYPAVGVSPVYELYKLTISTSVGYLVLLSFTFWIRNAESYSRAILFLSWLTWLIVIPLSRNLARGLYIHLNLWGVPTAIVGSGKYGQKVYGFLKQNPQLGMKPVLLVDGDVAKETQEEDMAPSHGLLVEEARLKSVCSKVDIIILVLPEIAQELLSKTLGKSLLQNRRVITVPDIQDFSSPWLTPVDFGGILGLEARQRISIDDRQFFKRILDIGIILVSAPIWLPTSIICSFLVLADSRGGIIFRQTRIGQDGRPMRILKFRTMIDNADRKLGNIINHDKYRLEWEKNYKLKGDPRITRIGRLLRKFSLDELPQIWNVLRGEMSMIGPRPIVTEEVKHYGARFNFINQVKPGLTGLWQVSGRNNLDYESRVKLDEYYVKNWSIWLDFYILLKTVEAIVSGKGAY